MNRCLPDSPLNTTSAELPLAFWAGQGVYFIDLLNQLGVGRVPTIDPPAYFFSFVRTSSVLQTALAIMRKLVNAAR